MASTDIITVEHIEYLKKTLMDARGRITGLLKSRVIDRDTIGMMKTQADQLVGCIKFHEKMYDELHDKMISIRDDLDTFKEKNPEVVKNSIELKSAIQISHSHKAIKIK